MFDVPFSTLEAQSASQPPIATAPAIAPPLMHYVSPAGAVLEGKYQCFGKTLRLRIDAGSGEVRVREYLGGNGPASAEALKQWNAALSKLSAVTTMELMCQRDDNEMIEISGLSTDSPARTIKVRAWWSSGRFGVF